MELTLKVENWAKKPAYTRGKGFREIVVANKRIYSIVYDERTIIEDLHFLQVHLLDQNDFTWKIVRLPENQDHTQIPPSGFFVALAQNTSIYIFSKKSLEIDNKNYASLYKFNTETNIWTKQVQRGNIPDFLNSWCEIVAADGKIIIYLRRENEVHFLDLDTFTWNFLTLEKGIFEELDSDLFVFQNRFIYYFERKYRGNFAREENLVIFDVKEKKIVRNKLSPPDPRDIPYCYLIGSGENRGNLYFFQEDDFKIYSFNIEKKEWKILDSALDGDRSKISGWLPHVLAIEDKIYVFYQGQDEDEDEVDSVLIFNFDISLQSLCIKTAVENKFDISGLPNKIQDEFKNFKWVNK